MKRARDTVSNTRKLRSSNSQGKNSSTELPTSSVANESGSKKTRTSKNTSREVGSSSSSAFKTPKTRVPDASTSRDVSSSSGSKGLPPINLDVVMQDKWPERPKDADVDFKVNLLSPVEMKPPTLPRHKRVPVQDPDRCLDVADYIFEMCYEQELRYSSNWDYMVCQPGLTWQMRAILVDWIVDVHHMMKLQGPTLWLTVNLIDRTLARRNMPRTRLQLVGIAALSLACKMEEIALPYPDDFTYITEDAYSCEDLLAMELEVLEAIHYEVHVPTGFHFLTRYLDFIHASDATRQLAFYYAERNLQETTALALMPSAYAAVCLYAALVQRDMHSEPVASHVPTEDLDEVVAELFRQLKEVRVRAAVEAGELPPEGSGQAPLWAYDFDVDDLDGDVNGDGHQLGRYVDGKWELNEVKLEPADIKIEHVDIKTEPIGDQAIVGGGDNSSSSSSSSAAAFTSDAISAMYVRLYHDCNKALQDSATPSSGFAAQPERPRALSSSVFLWDVNLSVRAPGRPLTREAYPVHPSQVAGAPRTTSSSSSGACGAPPLSSYDSRIARLLARLPPQKQKEVPREVTETELQQGVRKLLQELPGCVDVAMLQFYAKLFVEHVGKEVVSSSKRHLNAARRKYSNHSRRALQVANFGLPFFMAQDPTVHTELLGPILHRSSTAFYPGKIPCCPAVKLLNPSHFPIPASSSDLPAAAMAGASSSDEGVVAGAEVIESEVTQTVAPVNVTKRVLRSSSKVNKSHKS